MNQKIIIEYKGKKYEIDKELKEQKVKPKDGKPTEKEITVKNYQESLWKHTAECSEDGINFEEITIKRGIGQNLTLWGGGGSFLVILIGLLARKFTSPQIPLLKKLKEIETNIKPDKK